MRAVACLALAVLLVAGFAGCFGDKRPDYEGIEQGIAEVAALAIVRDHGSDEGHHDPALHAVPPQNMELVGYHNGFDGSADPNAIPPTGYYTELAVTHDYAYLSRASADGAFGGFGIIALNRDPAGRPHPEMVGEYFALGSADIEVSADEELAFFATQRSSIQQILTAGAQAQDPRPAEPRGIHVVDISDKTNPTQAAFVPIPNNGPHTLTYWASPTPGPLGEAVEYLLAATYDLPQSSFNYVQGVPVPVPLPLPEPIPLTHRVIVFQIQRGPGGDPSATVLVPVATYQVTDMPSQEDKRFFPHDTYVQVHPATGTPLLYVSYWDQGVHILDFSDPAAIADPASRLDFWTEFGPSAFTGIHFARPFDAPIDGLHVTVAEPEIQQAEGETGQITFLDTTDPANIRKLGHWTLPVPVSPGIIGFDYSPHNFDVFDGKVVLGHNHAGVWVIDVSDVENLRDPKSVGFAMPVTPRAGSPVQQPRVWGAFEQDGLIFASDEASGLYIYEYTGP